MKNKETAGRVVIEWAPFKVAPGVTEEQLLAAAKEIQDGFLKHQKGFLRRELLRDRDGGYVDVLHWTDQASVDAAMKEAMASPACAAYFQCMAVTDHASAEASVSFFDRVASY